MSVRRRVASAIRAFLHDGAGPALRGRPPVPDPNRPRHTLKFTGALSREEFEERCRQYDFWYHS